MRLSLSLDVHVAVFVSRLIGVVFEIIIAQESRLSLSPRISAVVIDLNIVVIARRHLESLYIQ